MGSPKLDLLCARTVTLMGYQVSQRRAQKGKGPSTLRSTCAPGIEHWVGLGKSAVANAALSIMADLAKKNPDEYLRKMVAVKLDGGAHLAFHQFRERVVSVGVDRLATLPAPVRALCIGTLDGDCNNEISRKPRQAVPDTQCEMCYTWYHERMAQQKEAEILAHLQSTDQLGGTNAP
jgi:hypothetical protein